MYMYVDTYEIFNLKYKTFYGTNFLKLKVLNKY